VPTALETLAEEIDWGDQAAPPTDMSVDDIQVQRRVVQAELKKIRQKAASLRSDMLQERAAAEPLAGNEESARSFDDSRQQKLQRLATLFYESTGNHNRLVD
jgi:hypothetical protein